ncbi:MAG: MBL fold metallo-hydrolase [Deltaproteobacteria bacterium]|nr:MBL fold metallo-hydrolase [Deltaproteobacteria bacterium]
MPYRRILARWLEADYQPAACRAALEAVIAELQLPDRFFDLEAFRHGGVVGTDALLLEAYAQAGWELQLVSREPALKRALELPASRVPAVGALIRALVGPGGDPSLLAAELAELLGPGLPALAPPAAAPRWPEIGRPGIYRREHASLVISSRTSCLVVDPLALAVGRFPAALSQSPTNLGLRRPDAILITHVHGDHWHLPSVLRYATDRDVPVVVPQVPAVSILTQEDPAEVLGLVGQCVRADGWDSSFAAGDIEVDILPFFGEQPTHDPPGPDPAIRNWGNCYRVNTPEFSVLVLVDSGADPAGDMLDVVEQSVRARGPVDVVLSCMQDFPSPFFAGVAHEFITLPFAQQRHLFQVMRRGQLPSATAGPLGAVQLCARAQAAHYLTYANGFSGLGVPNGLDWGAGAPEPGAIVILGQLLAGQGVRTQARSWNPGDIALLDAGRLDIVPYSQ